MPANSPEVAAAGSHCWCSLCGKESALGASVQVKALFSNDGGEMQDMIRNHRAIVVAAIAILVAAAIALLIAYSGGGSGGVY
jgi:hypothetical protein